MAQEPTNNHDVTNKEVSHQIAALTRTVQMLSDVLSTHVRSNIETLKEIREYIGSQIAYRSYREGIEESRLKLAIEEKNLEIRYKERLLQDEATANDALKLEQDKLKLELESLKENLEVLKVVKSTTQEKLKAMPHAQPQSNSVTNNDLKRTITLTATAFLTTAFLSGVGLLISFLIRQYILSTP